MVLEAFLNLVGHCWSGLSVLTQIYNSSGKTIISKNIHIRVNFMTWN